MTKTIAGLLDAGNKIRKIKMSMKRLHMVNMVVAGAVLIGFGIGTVPEWAWIPLLIYFGVGFLYPIYDDNRKKQK